MATKVRIKNLKEVEKNFRRRVEGYKNDAKSMEQVSGIIQGEMRRGVRDGIGYDGNPLPAISVDTAKRRARLATVNSTTKSFMPSRSNLSFTGDLVQKIFVEFIGRGKFQIFGKGNHKALKGIRVKKLEGSDAPIADIIEGQENRGYKIRGVFPKAKERIRNNFLAFLRRKK